MLEYQIEENVNIDSYLINKLQNKSKNNIKNLFTNDCIIVNDKVIKKHDYELKKNDRLQIITKQIKDKYYKIDVLYEDNYLIVINKPNGLLSVKTDKEPTQTAYNIVKNYIKNKNKLSKLFVIHRLDKDTSGILMFAKDEKTKTILQDNWDNLVKLREYKAIIEGKLEQTKGTIKSYLYETKDYKVISTKDPKKGKIAITNFEVIKKNKSYSLLKINLETGRKNQIRVHMNDLNVNILGDKKYKGNNKYAKRMYLHANKLIFIHPITSKEITIHMESPSFEDIKFK